MFMGRYSDEIVYDRIIDANGNTKKAQTIRVLDRKYDRDKVTIHIVSHGQNLMSIAEEYYDDFTKWYLIAEKNPTITNPFELPFGMELVIPDI